MVSVTFAMWGLGGSGGERLVYKLSSKLVKDGKEVNIISLVGYGFNEDVIKRLNSNVIIQNKLLRTLFSLQYLLEYNKNMVNLHFWLIHYIRLTLSPFISF